MKGVSLLQKILCAGISICLVLVLAGCGVYGGTTFSVGSVVSYEQADRYQEGDVVLSEPIREVRIHWLNGSVKALPSGDGTVHVTEDANQPIDAALRLRYWLDGEVLHIRPCASGTAYPSGLEKELTVSLPETGLQSLYVSSVSGEVSLKNMTAETVVLHGVSGRSALENCRISRLLEVQSTSGTLSGSLTGTLETLTFGSVSGSVSLEGEEICAAAFDTTSGSVTLKLQKAPNTLTHNSVSGGIAVTLPESADFALELNTVSGRFHSEIPCENRGKTYIAGDGENQYSIHNTSGNATIYAQ